MKKRTGCVDCLSDKESDRTHEKFPGLSLTNVLALGPGFRVHRPGFLPEYPFCPYKPCCIYAYSLPYGLCYLISLKSFLPASFQMDGSNATNLTAGDTTWVPWFLPSCLYLTHAYMLSGFIRLESNFSSIGRYRPRALSRVQRAGRVPATRVDTALIDGPPPVLDLLPLPILYMAGYS
jgi:hypothetical protein